MDQGNFVKCLKITAEKPYVRAIFYCSGTVIKCLVKYLRESTLLEAIWMGDFAAYQLEKLLVK